MKNGTAERCTYARDALRDTANLIGGALMAYLLATGVLRLLAGWFIKAFSKKATLTSPVGVPEWVIALLQLLIAIGALAAALQFLRRMTPGTLRPRLQVTDLKDRRLWIFLPVFLGVGVLCSMLTTGLQSAFEKQGWYVPAAPVILPKSGFALLLTFCTMCVVPAILEELLCRGMMQGMLRPWGAWFSIAVSSALFALMHPDFTHMPGIFLLSLCLGAVAWVSGSLMPGMVLHFINNVMAFLLTYLTQNTEDISGLSMAVYLLCAYVFATCVCVYYIWKWNLLAEVRPLYTRNNARQRMGQQRHRLRRMVGAPLLTAVTLWLVLWAVVPAFLPKNPAENAAKPPVSANSGHSSAAMPEVTSANGNSGAASKKSTSSDVSSAGGKSA